MTALDRTTLRGFLGVEVKLVICNLTSMDMYLYSAHDNILT